MQQKKTKKIRQLQSSTDLSPDGIGISDHDHQTAVGTRQKEGGTKKRRSEGCEKRMKTKRDKYLKKTLKSPEKDNSSEHLSQNYELISKRSARPEETDNKAVAQEAAKTLQNISTNFLSSLRFKKVNGCEIEISQMQAMDKDVSRLKSDSKQKLETEIAVRSLQMISLTGKREATSTISPL
eukprot:TRINITY_DN34118_c0_g1_i1.p1 TRINITY_DN34118_c0_g1~~TRINITY_DN34118_c0_g1_i1.p1  ORF type:complete len:181 (+),score=43.46 TRINITY_DN34118_c0_g1_i1:350-892(+)